MSPLRLPLVALLVHLSVTCAFAQLVDQETAGLQRAPPAPGSQVYSLQDYEPTIVGEPSCADPATNVEAFVDTIVEASCVNPLCEFWGYRYGTSSTGWIVGDGDQFGMFSLQSDHYQHPRYNSGIGVGLNFHFLAGPERTDMPPRVFDFSVGYQRRRQFGEFSYDIAASVMASSDFEGSSRDGIRFPGHAVGFLRAGAATDLVFGVDFLDRGDIRLLPVAGLIALPHPDLRLEMVFPRPRLVWRLTDKNRLSVSGELGGGSWAVERDSLVDDLATYRDFRLSVGLEQVEDDGKWSAFEVAYLFNRKLEYSSGNGDYYPNDTVMIRLVHAR